MTDKWRVGLDGRLQVSWMTCVIFSSFLFVRTSMESRKKRRKESNLLLRKRNGVSQHSEKRGQTIHLSLSKFWTVGEETGRQTRINGSLKKEASFLQDQHFRVETHAAQDIEWGGWSPFNWAGQEQHGEWVRMWRSKG